MRALEAQVVVEEDGVVTLNEMPVKVGDRVKLIILIPDEQAARRENYPLRGTQPYRFDNPVSLETQE